MRKYLNGHTKNSRRGVYKTQYCTRCGGRGRCSEGDLQFREKKSLRKVKGYREKYPHHRVDPRWMVKE